MRPAVVALQCLIAFLLGLISWEIAGEYAAGVPQCQGLKAWYDDYNIRYFYGELPKDTVVTYGRGWPVYMAATWKDKNGRFHIELSRRFNQSARVAHWDILHEMCHISAWEEGQDHGPRFRWCIQELELRGAYWELY